MRTHGAIDRKPRRNAEKPTLLRTTGPRAVWKVNMRVGTRSGPRRLGTVGPPSAFFGLPEGKEGTGTHVPVLWDDGSRSAEPRANLERMRPGRGARVRCVHSPRCGFITSTRVGLAHVYTLDPTYHHVMVRWDGMSDAAPVPEKELTVLWNANTTAPPLHGVVNFNNTHRFYAKLSEDANGERQRSPEVS